MRLTLRTLLAYLDDVLPADQAKELGQKLGESNYATALVDRIKDVLRRRRLSAPDLFGKSAGIDPNVVADYLDNELSPNDVGDVEKICLDSDVHLAEVAACHQILTLVLGEPVDVRPETRARMYALGPVAAKDVLRADDVSPTIMMGTSPRIAVNVEPVVTASMISPTDRTLPDYLKPKSSWRKPAFLALLLLVLGGWIGLLWSDGTLNLFGGNSPTLTNAGSPNPAANAIVQKADPMQIGNQAKAEASTQAQPTQIAAANSATDEAPATPSPLNEAGLARNTPASRSIANAEAPLNAPIPRKSQPAENPAAANTIPDSEDVPVQAVEPKTLAPLRMLYTARDGRLLHWDTRLADFLVLPNRSELRPNDRLACPEPFRADIVVGDDIAQVALIGGTAVTCLKPTDRAAIGFDIAQGVVLIEGKGLAPTSEPDDDKSSAPKTTLTMTIAFVLRGRSHLLELTTDDALCAIEVHRHEPLRFQTPSDEPGYSAALHVANGTVKLTKPDGQVEQLTGPGLLPLTADWAAPPKLGEPNRVGPTISPDWLEGTPKREVTRTKTPYKTAFEKEFDAEQPLLLTMPAIINNPRPALSELAVKCLALTDSYQPLVKALITVEHREARLAAITGLRQWLSQDPKHEALLKSELERHLPSGDTETVMRLMWGYSLADAKTPAASRQLVGWLEHDHVAIRELAFYHIQRLTGLKNEYSPVNPPSQRRVSVERWYTHLEKKNGALVAH